AEGVCRARAGEATSDVKLDGAAAASLAWLPQETILCDRARLKRAIDIDLAEHARLVLAEAIVFGRAGMGDTVDDGFLLDRWRVRRGGRLIHAPAMRLDGAVAARLAQPAVAEGGGARATPLGGPGGAGTTGRVGAPGR